MKIELQIATTEKNLPDAKKFAQWIDAAISALPKPPPAKQDQINIRIVDREESQHLNEEYRHKMGPTNVLSFPAAAIPGFELDYLGDLAICAAIVKEEAKAQNKTLESHWAHMAIHGFLHLLGYDHIDENDAEKMESLETKIMQQLNFLDPYSD